MSDVNKRTGNYLCDKGYWEHGLISVPKNCPNDATFSVVAGHMYRSCAQHLARCCRAMGEEGKRNVIVVVL